MSESRGKMFHFVQNDNYFGLAKREVLDLVKVFHVPRKKRGKIKEKELIFFFFEIKDSKSPLNKVE
ncbi:MAG: hypothetical protein R3Y27_08010 [Clostridia bacterium]